MPGTLFFGHMPHFPPTTQSACVSLGRGGRRALVDWRRLVVDRGSLVVDRWPFGVDQRWRLVDASPPLRTMIRHAPPNSPRHS